MCVDIRPVAGVGLGCCNLRLVPEASSTEEPAERLAGVQRSNALGAAGRIADEPELVALEGIAQVVACAANIDGSKMPEKDSVGPLLAVRAGGAVMEFAGIAGPGEESEASSVAENAVVPDIAAGSAERRTGPGLLEGWDMDEHSEVTSTGRLGSRASFLGSGHISVVEARSGGGPLACGSGTAVVPCSPHPPDLLSSQ